MGCGSSKVKDRSNAQRQVLEITPMEIPKESKIFFPLSKFIFAWPGYY